jgi:uncharacterized protein YjbJ (UPF0337 family)
MVAQNDILQPRWHEVKSQVNKRWGKFTEDEISKLTGSQEQLVYALRRRYGYALGQAQMEIQRWLADYDKDNVRPRR